VRSANKAALGQTPDRYQAEHIVGHVPIAIIGLSTV
jgi:hypothetical protein